MRDHENLLTKSAKFLDLPVDIFENSAHIELCGLTQALIENHKGFLEYSDTTLELNLGAHILTICGQRLNISAMDEKGLRLEGIIEKLEFQPV